MALMEVTHESWFGRLGKSVKAVLVGLLLLAAGAVLLFWNEGRAVREAQTIEEGRQNVVSVDAGRVEAANEGKLVHVRGEARTDETLTDAAFGVSAPAVKLRRTVEMYQWEERKHTRTERRPGGGTRTVTTYDYAKAWSQRPIDSSTFRDSTKTNPPGMRFRSETLTARNVLLGAFRLSESLLGQLNAYQPLPVTEGPEAAAPQVTGLEARDGGLYLPREGARAAAGPQIGDLRIHFEVVRPGPASVMSRQAGGTFEPYRSKAGNTIDMLQAGLRSTEEIFQRRSETNRLVTWGLRAGGFVVLLIGFLLILHPISVLGDVVPLIGSLLGAGAFLVSLVLAVSVSLAVVALGWIVYRPVWGAALLAAALVVFFGARAMVKGRRRSPTAAPPPPPPAR